MANTKKSTNKAAMEVIDAEVVETKEKTKESTLYYFYSTGCGFCKKTEPLVDELIKDGYAILKLDIADASNSGLKAELEQEYGSRCGTPFFIDGKSGNLVCGFREKDILEKWANGEEIPAPPRPTGPPPKPPFHGATKKEVSTWKKEYGVWLKDNEHMPNLQTTDQILSRPRPKSEPPRPPAVNATSDQKQSWKKQWDDWAKENSHLPNLQDGESILNRMATQQKQQRGPVPPPNQPRTEMVDSSTEFKDVMRRMDSLELKLTQLLNHLGVKHS